MKLETDNQSEEEEDLEAEQTSRSEDQIEMKSFGYIIFNRITLFNFNKKRNQLFENDNFVMIILARGTTTQVTTL